MVFNQLVFIGTVGEWTRKKKKKHYKIIQYNTPKFSRNRKVGGEGLLNTLINKLPIEIHLPGYQYCGPGTHLQKRLARGDLGINQLDRACKEHDIAYHNHKDTEGRRIADKILIERAWNRVIASDSSLSERKDAWLVTNLMKGKNKLGMGIGDMKKLKTKRPTKMTIKKKKKKMIKKKKNNNSGCADGVKNLFRRAVKGAKNSLLGKNPEEIESAISMAMGAVKKVIKKTAKKSIKPPPCD